MQFSAPIKAAIAAKAIAHKIEWQFIAAIVAAESSGNPFKTRHEPASGKNVTASGRFAQLTGISADTETVGQMISWGLCQVMGFRARELGFRGLFPELCEPEIGLEFGCAALKDLAARFDMEAKYTDGGLLTFSEGIAAAYNHGSPRKNPDGNWFNQAYVVAVREFYMDFSAGPS